MKFKLEKPYNWLIFKLINPHLEEAIATYAQGILIDIGCGEKPYEEMIEKYVDKHIGLDYEASLHGNKLTDLIGTAYDIPLEDKSCDTVLCTDVLEHLEEPKKAVKEAFRILKSKGYGIYTVPLYWHLHEEPRDFYRYTKYGLEYLFKENGFQVVKIKALSGFIANYSQSLAYYLWQFRFPRGGRVNPMYWIIRILVYVVQWFGYNLNKIDRSERFTIEYLAIVRKP